MYVSHSGVFLISVKPMTTENTKNKTTPKICKITVYAMLWVCKTRESDLARCDMYSKSETWHCQCHKIVSKCKQTFWHAKAVEFSPPWTILGRHFQATASIWVWLMCWVWRLCSFYLSVTSTPVRPLYTTLLPHQAVGLGAPQTIIRCVSSWSL